MSSRIDGLRARHLEARKEFAARKKELEKNVSLLQSRLATAENRLCKAEDQLRMKKSEAEAAAPAAVVSETRLQQTIAGLEREKQKLIDHIGELKTALRKEQTARSALQGRAKDRATQLSEKIGFLEVNLDSSTELLEKAQAELGRQKTEAEKRVAAAESVRSELSEQVEIHRKKAGAAEEEVTRLRVELDTARSDLEQAALQGTEASRALEAGLAEAKAELAARDKALDAASRDLERSEAELDGLRTAREAMERELGSRIQEIEERALQAESQLEQAIQEADREKDLRENAESRVGELEDRIKELSTQAEAPPAEEEVPPAPPQEIDLYLKLGEDGEVFGPTTFSDLYDWACQCRIGPDHLISLDKVDWLPAAEVADLEMQWEVRLVDGTLYGPINLHAIRYLVEDHAVADDASVKNVVTGASSILDELLDSERNAGAKMPAVQ